MSDIALEIRRFRSGFLSGLVLLVVQFLHGMAVNLFAIAVVAYSTGLYFSVSSP